jgi:hypothetical protein
MAEEKHQSQADLTELWNELLDCMDELRGDLKDGTRARRHLKNLQQKVGELGDAMVTMAGTAKGKRGFLR